jgi:hypothetical protein
VPRAALPDKQCAKCVKRQPLNAFFDGLDVADGPIPPRGSRFCVACRTTLKRCGVCERQRPISAFAHARGGKYGWCVDCYLERRRVGYADAARLFAAAATKAGQDPSTSRGYRWYSQDGDEVLRFGGRRRKARERAALKDGYTRLEIFDRDRWRCAICARPLDRESATIDHVIPLLHGGSDTRDNVRTACRACNSRRGAPTPDLG